MQEAQNSGISVHPSMLPFLVSVLTMSDNSVALKNLHVPNVSNRREHALAIGGIPSSLRIRFARMMVRILC